MKNCNLGVKALCLAVAMMFASVCYAQKIVIFAGSEGAYADFGLAGVLPDPLTQKSGPCAPLPGVAGGYNLWTANKDISPIFAVGVDANRNIAFPDEPGDFWVEWDNSTSPTVVCAYLKLDSVVANRLLFGTYGAGGHATFRFDMPLGTAAGPAIPSASDACPTGTSQAGASDLAPYLADNPGLPCPVYLALVGQQFTAVVSELRPEDSEFAMQRVAAPCAGANCFVGRLRRTRQWLPGACG